VWRNGGGSQLFPHAGICLPGFFGRYSAVVSSRRTGRIARILALSLLIAQFGAEAHALSHLGDDPHSAPETAQSCRICLSFAPVVGAVGGSHAQLRIDPAVADHVPIADTAPIPCHRPNPPFQSRAPPHSA
jgi:hypothetical protein